MNIIKLVIGVFVGTVAAILAFAVEVMDSDKCLSCGSRDSYRIHSRTVCKSCDRYRGSY